MLGGSGHSVCPETTSAGTTKLAPLQIEQLPQTARLCAAYRNLGLLLICHPQLIGALEPRHDFANLVNVDQERSVRAPEHRRIEQIEQLVERAALRLPFQRRRPPP